MKTLIYSMLVLLSISAFAQTEPTFGKYKCDALEMSITELPEGFPFITVDGEYNQLIGSVGYWSHYNFRHHYESTLSNQNGTYTAYPQGIVYVNGNFGKNFGSNINNIITLKNISANSLELTLPRMKVIFREGVRRDGAVVSRQVNWAESAWANNAGKYNCKLVEKYARVNQCGDKEIIESTIRQVIDEHFIKNERLLGKHGIGGVSVNTDNCPVLSVQLVTAKDETAARAAIDALLSSNAEYADIKVVYIVTGAFQFQ